MSNAAPTMTQGPSVIAHHHRAPPPYTGPVYANFQAAEAQQPRAVQPIAVGGANAQPMQGMYVLAYVPVSSLAAGAPNIAAPQQPIGSAPAMAPPPSYQSQPQRSGMPIPIQKPQGPTRSAAAAVIPATQPTLPFAPAASDALVAPTPAFVIQTNTFAFPMQGLSASKHTTDFLPARQGPQDRDRDGGESPTLFSVPSLNPSIWLNREANDIDASMWSISERPVEQRVPAAPSVNAATAQTTQNQPTQKKVTPQTKGSDVKLKVDSQPASNPSAVPTAPNTTEATPKGPKPNFTDICRHRAMGACNRKHCRFVHPSDAELTMLRAIGKLPPLPDPSSAESSSENGASDTHSSWMGSKESERSDV